MSDVTYGGVTVAPEHGSLPDTSKDKIDHYLTTLKSHQEEWANYPIEGRIRLLEKLQDNLIRYLDEWALADSIGRHIPEGHPEMVTSVRSLGIVGAYVRNYMYAFKQLKANGGRKPYVKGRQQGSRVVVETFPSRFLDKIIMKDVHAEIWLKPGTKLSDLADYQASLFKEPNYHGGVSLIMPAGNLSSAIFSDLFQKLLMEKKVCLIKMHPAQDFMLPVLEKVLKPFIDQGFVRLVAGGSIVGRYLTQHPLVDDIQMTGSDKTFEEIVFGSGELRQQNKKDGHLITDKPVACELGSINPVIVVPGNWTDEQLEFQARNIFSMIATNNAYACVGARMLILPKHWEKGEKLVSLLENLFMQSTLPVNYYPGTDDVIKDAKKAYSSLEVIGDPKAGEQPWMLAKNLDSSKNEVAFQREFWGAFVGQTYVPGKDKAEYLKNAVEFANKKLWGTLAATIIIDPLSQKELVDDGSLLEAIDQLKYGIITVNGYAGLGLILGTNPWGGYPATSSNDIQSGNTFTCNPFLLNNIEKSVTFAPFKDLPLNNWKKGVRPNLIATRAFSVFLITGKLTDFFRFMKARRSKVT